MTTPLLTQTQDQPLNEDACFAAVRQRDRAADGTFFVAITTTGVYCRPTCSARAALRKNMRFFTTADSAAAAGFRPCKRCRPIGPSLADDHAAIVARAIRLLESSDDTQSLDELAHAVSVSPYHLHRIFVNVTGTTPRRYAAALRAKRVRETLHAAPRVADAAYDAGFGSSSRFYDTAHATLGMSPRAYRAGGAGMAISYALADTTLGTIIVAWTERGLCSVRFGDARDALVTELQTTFPQAQIAVAHAAQSDLVRAVIEQIEAPQRAHTLPLDIRGTAFQLRVWNALAAIPSGSTITYAQLAARLGDANGARAVAGAVAKNSVAVVVPCHRVVRADGSDSGYRWGLDRKRALLDRESSRSR